MTFDEAIELARDCAAHYSRITVVAVGKFVPAEELERTEKWGVSVIADRTRKMVLWDRGDLMTFADVDKPKGKSTKSKSKRPEPVDQMLF